jgi:hypothetical protein
LPITAVFAEEATNLFPSAISLSAREKANAGFQRGAQLLRKSPRLL